MPPQWLMTIPALLILSLIPNTIADAGQDVPGSKGLNQLAQALLRLPVVASLLNTGAHPDDENSALLAYASQGLHVRTAYLSLNRGEGGQNLIGPELYDAIGTIRTEELLAARRFDGASQYFTRAYDFGFSKSGDEALTLWNKDERLLADVVRIIRTFRPDVVVSVFAGSAADGHGQHQAAGLMTREAFRAAADPKRFPEQIADGLRPWQPRKLYINNTRATFSAMDSLTISVGDYNPVLDQSYRELGSAGRSMHRSQDMGAIQARGPATTKIKLVERLTGQPVTAPDRGLFDGIDTSFLRLATIAGSSAAKVPAFEDRLRQLDSLTEQAIRDFRPFEPVSALPSTLEAIKTLRAVRSAVMKSPLDRQTKDDILALLGGKEQDMVEVIHLALGLSFEALANRETVTPGSSFAVALQLLNRSKTPVRVNRFWLNTPGGWTATSQNPVARLLDYNESSDDTVTVSVAADAQPTRPYWRRSTLHDTRVTVDSENLIGLPWALPAVIGHVSFMVDDVPVELTQPVQYRYADPAIGEIRRELQVTPAFSVTLTPEVTVLPLKGKSLSRTVQVTVRTTVPNGGTGLIRLEVPTGWRVTPEQAPVSFSEANQATTWPFVVTAPNATPAGAYQVRASVISEGKTYREGYREITYPHIQTRRLYRGAVTTIELFDIGVAANLKVGYIMGVGDEVPQAIQQLGVAVHLIDKEELASGDLSQYDAIVAGIRAYEARPDLVALNSRLLEYVQAGGTFIVQYNQYIFNTGQFGLYPATIRTPHDRVTDENAPVDLLVPNHPLFNTPNKITDDDFKGWIQERGLYFFGKWDARYTPLMASHDAGEAPQAGGMLEARVGKGRYIYTGYAWFRQLPAGVPGAFRLFANLLSLPKTELTP